MQSSKSLLKTQTLENMTSVVGSSTQMEKLDIVGRNVVIDAQKQKAGGAEINSDIREVSEQDTNMQSKNFPTSAAQSRPKIQINEEEMQIVKKLSLNPRVGVRVENHTQARINKYENAPQYTATNESGQ